MLQDAIFANAFKNSQFVSLQKKMSFHAAFLKQLSNPHAARFLQYKLRKT